MSEEREQYGTEVATRSKTTGSSLMVFDQDGANHLYRLAKTMSESNLVPKHFQGKPADCFLGVEMAQRLRVAPFMVLQNLYVVHGTPAWKSQFLIAMANRSGTFTGSIMFEQFGEGDGLEVVAYATHAQSGDRVESRVSMAMATAEGWTSNSKYKSMPVQMLRYRAATFLVRTYCPEVTMGLMTENEVETIPTSEIDVSDPVIDVKTNGEEQLRVARESARDAGVDVSDDMDAAAIYEAIKNRPEPTPEMVTEPPKEATPPETKPVEKPSPEDRDAKIETLAKMAKKMEADELAMTVDEMIEKLSSVAKAAYFKELDLDPDAAKGENALVGLYSHIEADRQLAEARDQSEMSFA